MESKGTYIILLVIIAVLTLSLALMAGYILFVADTPKDGNNVNAVNNQEKIPDDSELEIIELYSEKTSFNLKSENVNNAHYLTLTAKLKCFKNVNGIRNVKEKIELYNSDIKELIGTYFQNVTIEQVSKPEERRNIKEELTEKINVLLSANEDKKVDMVYTIVFDEWVYQ